MRVLCLGRSRVWGADFGWYVKLGSLVASAAACSKVLGSVVVGSLLLLLLLCVGLRLVLVSFCSI